MICRNSGCIKEFNPTSAYDMYCKRCSNKCIYCRNDGCMNKFMPINKFDLYCVKCTTEFNRQIKKQQVIRSEVKPVVQPEVVTLSGNLIIGRIGKKVVELRCMGCKLYIPHVGNPVYTSMNVDSELLNMTICNILNGDKARKWIMYGQLLHSPLFTQTVVWDEVGQFAAYVMFSRNGNIITAYKHKKAGVLEGYTTKTKYVHTSITEMVDSLDKDKEYDTVL